MLCPCATSFGFVVHKCLHANGDEGEGGIIMRAIQMRVGGDVWVCVALAEEEKLPFRLWNGLAPKAKEEGAGGAAENGHKVVFSKLDCFFGDVAAVVVGGD